MIDTSRASPRPDLHGRPHPRPPPAPRDRGPRGAAGLRLGPTSKVLTFCPTTPEEQKSLETFQDQVIDRVFVFNAERAKEERRLGLGTKKPKSAKAGKQKLSPPANKEGLGFDD